MSIIIVCTTYYNEGIKMINLTEREVEVIKLLAEGKTNAQIGQILFISVHTVKSILEKLYVKTSCNSRVQVVVYAIINNILK